MKKKLVSLLLVACMAVSLAACGSNGGDNSGTKGSDNNAGTEDNNAGSEAPEEEGDAAEGENEGGSSSGASGNVITACIASEPETIDPSLNSSVDGATYIQHVFEGLMKFQPVEGQMEPEVVPGQAAEEPTVSEDGMTWTFKLRDDIVWSDGQPVTANDFVYSWQRIVDPATASDYNYIIDMVVNAPAIRDGQMDKSELGITAIDDKTLEIKLSSPCAYFRDLCAFSSLMPLRQDIVEGNDSWTFDNYIGNGKYVVSNWTHDDSIEMTVNDKYYAPDEIKNEGIIWKLMDDENAMLAEFNSGSLDFINSMPVDETARLLADGTMQVTPYLGTYTAVFNIEKAPFDDPLVRKAFSLAIDRNYICETVTQRGEQPASGWVPDGITNYAGGDFRADGGDYYSVDPADYEANCEEARRLLAEAGYPDGEGFPIVEYLYNTNDGHQKIYEALAYMWQEELGVTVNGSNQDWNVFLDTRSTGGFEVARHGWIADINDAVNFLDMWTTSQIDGNNYARWSNEEFDQLISGSVTEADAAARQEMLHKAEDIMMEDMIVAPIYFYVEPYCLSDRLTGASHTSLGYWFFWNLEAK